MKKQSFMLAFAAVLAGSIWGCGSNINEAFLLAGESGARTFLDILVSDLYADAPDLFSFPPPAGEPNSDADTGSGDTTGNGDADGGDTGGDGSGGDTGGGSADLTGDADNGATVYQANGCTGCHCDDASGGCLPGAPALTGVDITTLDDKIRGDASHAGGKFDSLTDQEVADLAAFLAG